MTRVLVAYGSRHGGTRGIAERIGEVLRSEGLEADVVAADRVGDLGDADAFVVGSGVYMGSWLKEPLEFLVRNQAALAARPLWLFSSGPLIGSSAGKNTDDPLEDALGPTEGPGSGGRKKIDEISAATHPRDHRVFFGAFDPTDPPRAMSERLVRLMPAARKVLPAGDFRDWDAIEAWAHGIATELQAAIVPACTPARAAKPRGQGTTLRLPRRCTSTSDGQARLSPFGSGDALAPWTYDRHPLSGGGGDEPGQQQPRHPPGCGRGRIRRGAGRAHGRAPARAPSAWMSNGSIGPLQGPRRRTPAASTSRSSAS